MTAVSTEAMWLFDTMMMTVFTNHRGTGKTNEEALTHTHKGGGGSGKVKRLIKVKMEGKQPGNSNKDRITMETPAFSPHQCHYFVKIKSAWDRRGAPTLTGHMICAASSRHWIKNKSELSAARRPGRSWPLLWAGERSPIPKHARGGGSVALPPAALWQTPPPKMPEHDDLSERRKASALDRQRWSCHNTPWQHSSSSMNFLLLLLLSVWFEARQRL